MWDWWFLKPPVWWASAWIKLSVKLWLYLKIQFALSKGAVLSQKCSLERVCTFLVVMPFNLVYLNNPITYLSELVCEVERLQEGVHVASSTLVSKPHKTCMLFRVPTENEGGSMQLFECQSTHFYLKNKLIYSDLSYVDIQLSRSNLKFPNH